MLVNMSPEVGIDTQHDMTSLLALYDNQCAIFSKFSPDLCSKINDDWSAHVSVDSVQPASVRD